MTSVLDRHRLIATTDVDEARAEVAQRFCAHRLELTARDGRLDMVHNAAPLSDGISLNYLRYGDEVRITPGALNDFYLLQIPLAGTARVRIGDTVVASDRDVATLPSPTEPVDQIWSDGCEQLLVYVRRQLVEAQADGEAVRFDPRVRLDTPLVRSWLQLLGLVRDELDRGASLLTTDLTRSHLEQTLVAGLLAAQPNTSRHAPTEPAAVGSRAVRRAVALIEEDPARDWTVADLAADVGVGVRSLQEGFRTERGTTPLAELRGVRLTRAHADLVRADPGTTTVADVATRWGFFHLGRFSATYRDRFGEPPSRTLAEG